MKKLTQSFAFIKQSIDIFGKKENFLFLIKVYSPLGIFSLISLLLSYISLGNLVTWILNLVFFLIAVFTNLAGIIAINKILEGQELKLNQVFSQSASRYWKILLLTILLYLLWSLGIVLLIVPFVLFVTWYAFSKFIMVEKGYGISMSLSQSKKLVKGRFWQVLWRVLNFALFSLFCQIVLAFLPYGIGIVIFYSCGGLFLLPSILLYKEVSASKALSE